MTRLLFAIAAALLLSAPHAAAQGAQVLLGTITHDTDQQIEISADQLSVDQATGVSIFSGGVVVGQGDMRLNAQEVRIEYTEDENGGGGISRLMASGGVTLVTPGEAAEAQEAIYTVSSGIIEMRGDVLLTQGANALSGQRLVVDMTRGTGTMEGRVRTIIQPGTNIGQNGQ